MPATRHVAGVCLFLVVFDFVLIQVWFFDFETGLFTLMSRTLVSYHLLWFSATVQSLAFSVSDAAIPKSAGGGVV